MAVIPPLSAQPASFGGWAPALADVAASLGTRLRKWQQVRDHPVPCRDVAATASLDEVTERVARLDRVVEQVAGAPVPEILESFGEGAQLAPQERVQNRASGTVSGCASASDHGQILGCRSACAFEALPRTIGGSGVSLRCDHGEISEVIQPILLERIQERIVRPMSLSAVPHSTEKTTEGAHASTYYGSFFSRCTTDHGGNRGWCTGRTT